MNAAQKAPILRTSCTTEAMKGTANFSIHNAAKNLIRSKQFFGFNIKTRRDRPTSLHGMLIIALNRFDSYSTDKYTNSTNEYTKVFKL